MVQLFPYDLRLALGKRFLISNFSLPPFSLRLFLVTLCVMAESPFYSSNSTFSPALCLQTFN